MQQVIISMHHPRKRSFSSNSSVSRPKTACCECEDEYARLLESASNNLVITSVITITMFKFVILNLVVKCILTDQCWLGICRNQRFCLQNYRKQTPICGNLWPEISLFIGYSFVFQTVNRGDPRKVPNNENVNIWKMLIIHIKQ